MTLSSLVLAGALAVGLPGKAHHDCSQCEDWKAGLPAEVSSAIAPLDALLNPPASPPATPEAEAQAALDRDIQRDIELGRKYSEEIAKELKFSENVEMVARVERIGKEMSEIANRIQVQVSFGDRRRTVFPYTFRVVKGDDVNAFSIPGGFIYIYEGLITYSESDAELAGVIAHEISHAAFRHVAEVQRRASRLDLAQIPLILAALLTQSPDALVALQAGNLASQAFRSGWSLNAEQSADWGAIQYMVQSPYNPVGVLTFMERLAYRDTNNAQVNWGIYATHPPSKERAQFIVSRLRELQVPIRRSEVTTSLRASTRIGDDQGIELLFGKTKLHTFRGEGAILRSEEAVKKLNRFADRVPGLEELSREGYTLRAGGRPLFEVAQADLLPGQELDASFVEVLNRTRSAIFDLNYRIWTFSAPS